MGMDVSTDIATGFSAADVANLRRAENLSSPFEALATHSGDGDTVSVSREARLLSEALRTAETSPDVRTDKVEALRIQVAEGTYRPDSRLIAENLLREEPNLFVI